MGEAFVMVHGGYSTDAIMGYWWNISLFIPTDLLVVYLIPLGKRKDYVHNP